MRTRREMLRLIILGPASLPMLPIAKTAAEGRRDIDIPLSLRPRGYGRIEIKARQIGDHLIRRTP